MSKKFINDSQNLRQELLEGLSLANTETVFMTQAGLIVNQKLATANRVTVVSLGGTGHEPALEGYVGEGMLDVSIPGDIFAAPGPQLCFDALKLADKGKGTLFIVLNHAGDMLTGNMTMSMVGKTGMNVVKLVTEEDISTAPRERSYDRRGLVGCVPVYKIAGAAAAKGMSLAEVAEVAGRYASNMATLAVACRGATHPVTDEAISILGEDEMEIGMGQHGEGGGGRSKMKTADETVEIMVEALIKDLSLKPGERVMAVVNGSGSTTHMEMFIIYRKVYQLLNEKNIKIVANMVGEILTTQETAGFQLCIARMDDELIDLWNAPCYTPYLVK